MNIVEEIKAMDKTILMFLALAFFGLLIMNVTTGREAYAGLVITLLSAVGAGVYFKTKKKTEIKSNVKPVKIS